jgi:hypothetical protein
MDGSLLEWMANGNETKGKAGMDWRQPPRRRDGDSGLERTGLAEQDTMRMERNGLDAIGRSGAQSMGREATQWETTIRNRIGRKRQDCFGAARSPLEWSLKRPDWIGLAEDETTGVMDNGVETPHWKGSELSGSELMGI